MTINNPTTHEQQNGGDRFARRSQFSESVVRFLSRPLEPSQGENALREYFNERAARATYDIVSSRAKSLNKIALFALGAAYENEQKEPAPNKIQSEHGKTAYWGNTLHFIGFNDPSYRNDSEFPVYAKGYILPELTFDGEVVKVETLKLAVSSKLKNGRYCSPYTDMVINGTICIGIDSFGKVHYATDGTGENHGHTLEGLELMLIDTLHSVEHTNPVRTIPEIEKYVQDAAHKSQGDSSSEV